MIPLFCYGSMQQIKLVLLEERSFKIKFAPDTLFFFFLLENFVYPEFFLFFFYFFRAELLCGSTSSCRQNCAKPNGIGARRGGSNMLIMYCVYVRTLSSNFYRCIRRDYYYYYLLLFIIIYCYYLLLLLLYYYYLGTLAIQSDRIYYSVLYLHAPDPKHSQNCPSDCRASAGAQLVIKFER